MSTIGGQSQFLPVDSRILPIITLRLAFHWWWLQIKDLGVLIGKLMLVDINCDLNVQWRQNTLFIEPRSMEIAMQMSLAFIPSSDPEYAIVIVPPKLFVVESFPTWLHQQLLKNSIVDGHSVVLAAEFADGAFVFRCSQQSDVFDGDVDLDRLDWKEYHIATPGDDEVDLSRRPVDVSASSLKLRGAIK